MCAARARALRVPGRGAPTADGSLLVASPIDPTFFVLSRLFAARAARAASTHGGRRERAGDEPARPLYEPLSDLLTNLDCPALCALAHAPGIGARLAPACDVNAKYADVLVRFDEAKALRWLRAKVAQIQARRPPLLVGDEARTHVVCAGTLDEHAPALRAGAGGAGTFAARPDASGAAPDAARAAREAVIGARAAVSDLSALALLAEYVRDDALQLVAQSYGCARARPRGARAARRRVLAIAPCAPALRLGVSAAAPPDRSPRAVRAAAARAHLAACRSPRYARRRPSPHHTRRPASRRVCRERRRAKRGPTRPPARLRTLRTLRRRLRTLPAQRSGAHRPGRPRARRALSAPATRLRRRRRASRRRSRRSPRRTCVACSRSPPSSPRSEAPRCACFPDAHGRETWLPGAGLPRKSDWRCQKSNVVMSEAMTLPDPSLVPADELREQLRVKVAPLGKRLAPVDGERLRALHALRRLE